MRGNKVELNIVLRGQSNAQLLLQFGAAAAIQSSVQNYLGFDGTTNKVNLIATHDQPNGDNTLDSGTSFLTQWLSARNGNWQNGWTNNTLETGFLNELASLPADEKSAPTDILFVHNEYDSADASLSAAEFQSAVQYDARQVRAVLGQTAATTPYSFVDIPYGEGTDTGNQAIKLAQQNLAGQASFNGQIAARANDLDMNWDLPNNQLSSFYGDGHMSPADANELVDRIARSIADSFAKYAQPGSPVANAGGKLPDTGPQVTQAYAVKGHANEILVAVKPDSGAALQPLNATAAAGVGWSVLDNGVDTPATGAAIEPGGKYMLLTFANAVPVDGSDAVYYGYGIGRTALPYTQANPNGFPGEGNAVYDSNGLPIWASAAGVKIAGSVTVPSASADVSQASASQASGPVAARTSGESGQDTLVLNVAAGAGQGTPQFVVSLDGQALGGVQTIAATGQAETFSFSGDWGGQPHAIDIASVGTAGADAPAIDLGGIAYDGLQYNDGGVLHAGQHLTFSVG